MSVIRNDLTSLPNWSQWFNDTTKATVGQHTLKVKAKGSGYRDSKLGTAVTFNIYSISTTLAGCTATHESRILQHTNVVIVFTAKEGFTFTNTTISTAQIKIGSTAYTPTSADTYVVSTDGTTATLTINAEAVIGNIAVTVALTEKLAAPTEFTVTKGLASWNSVDKATAYEFVAVDSNNVESSIGSYTPKTLSETWEFNATIEFPTSSSSAITVLSQSINFTSNNATPRYDYLNMEINHEKNPERWVLYYGYIHPNYGNAQRPTYATGVNAGWEYDDPNLRTIDFGTTPQTVTDEFYNWFTANATKQ